LLVFGDLSAHTVSCIVRSTVHASLIASWID